jgi:hypothetical protein
MDNWWLTLAVLALYLMNIFSAIVRIRQHTLERIDYLRLVQGALCGELIIDNVNLWYVQHADIDTFITYQGLENTLTAIATILLAASTVILLWGMVRVRRKMRIAWFAPEDKIQIRLYEAVQNIETATRLSLPIELRWRVHWRDFWFNVGIVFGLLEIIMVFAAFTLPAGYVWLVIGGIQVFWGAMLGLITAIYLAPKERLILTAEGIQLHRAGFTTRVQWTDACLFAWLKNDTFELSSVKHTIRTRRLKNTHSASYVPTMPYPEYARLFDSFILTVAERTGLPLVDLRDKTPL